MEALDVFGGTQSSSNRNAELMMALRGVNWIELTVDDCSLLLC